MTALLVPPHADLTMRAETDGVTVVAEPGRRFIRTLVSGQSRHGDGAGDIWARAARIAVSEGDPLLRLRALDALLRDGHRPGDGVLLRLDDLELASGTTEDLPDVLAAADAPAPYDAEVSASVDEVAGAARVRVVIDRDQQLPAALSAMSRLKSAEPLEITGRFAARHWRRLRSAPRLDPAPRLGETPQLGETASLERVGPCWRVAPEWCPPGTAVTWRERAADPVPAGRWAGRMSLRDVLRAHEPSMAGILGRALTVVLGICGLADGSFIGRGGSRVPAEALARALDGVRAAGARAVAELWVGAPGITPDQIRQCAAALRGAVPVVGFRVFDWPVSWSDGTWAGHPVTLRRRPHDLSRRHEIVSPRTIPADERDALLRELAEPLRRERSLVPGRVAGAYLWPPREPWGESSREGTAGLLLLDEDAVVLPHPDGSRLAAVSFRTGTAVTLPGALRPVLGTGQGCGPRPAGTRLGARRGAPSEADDSGATGGGAADTRFERTVDKLVHTGILRRAQ